MTAPVSRSLTGRLHKKGTALFYSVWSHRHFELDVCKQTLQWFKCTSSGDNNSVGIKRGEISLCRASAVILASVKKPEDKSEPGVRFVISYYKENSSMPLDMFMSAPSLVDACLWIAHINKAGAYHENPIGELEILSPICASVEDKKQSVDSDAKTGEKQDEKGEVSAAALGADNEHLKLSAVDLIANAVEALVKAILFIVWFLTPLYPLLLDTTRYQQIAYVGTLYCVYVLPNTYRIMISPSKNEDKLFVEDRENLEHNNVN
jgi:hypothetical protein